MDEKCYTLWPLVLFTALLPAAIGLETGSALTCLTADVFPEGVWNFLLWSAGLTIISGILVSFHLGHAQRGLGAVRGAKHSFLSHEIIMAYGFGVLLAASIICVHMTKEEKLVGAVLVITGVWGLATALSIGRVYNLPAQVTWRGWTPCLGPVTGSVLTAGSVYYVLTGSMDTPGRWAGVFYLILALEALFTVKRFRDFFILENWEFILAYPRQKGAVNFCYALKLILTTAIVILFIIRYYIGVLFLVIFQMFLDRMAFYGSAARKTPQAQMAAAKKERMQAALNP